MANIKDSKKKCEAFRKVFILAFTPMRIFKEGWDIMATFILIFTPTIIEKIISYFGNAILDISLEIKLIWGLGISTLLFLYAAYTIQMQFKSEEEKEEEKQKNYRELELIIEKLNELRERGITIQTKYEKLLSEKSEFINGFGFNHEDLEEGKIEMEDWINEVLKYLKENRKTQIFIGKIKMLGSYVPITLPTMIDKKGVLHKESEELRHHIERRFRLEKAIDKLEDKLISL